MSHAEFLCDIAALQHGFDAPSAPLYVVDLDRIEPLDRPLRLPPCPVIGLGDSDHPIAHRLDCVAEPPIRIDRLIQQVLARPQSAAILVQLLRAIDGQRVDAALVSESLAFAALQGGAEHRDWLAARPAKARQPSGELHLSRANDVVTILVHRPHAANAIDAPLRDSLREALDLACLDRTIARIELRGAGRNFGVGADLAEFGTTRDPAAAHLIRMQTLPAMAAAECGDRMVSMVQGLCVGSSLELAAFGRIEASGDAIFHLPELKMGIIPGAGGCASLSRKIGRQRTALMVLSGRRINVGTALEWGLVDRIVD